MDERTQDDESEEGKRNCRVGWTSLRTDELKCGYYVTRNNDDVLGPAYWNVQSQYCNHSIRITTLERCKAAK